MKKWFKKKFGKNGKSALNGIESLKKHFGNI